MSFYFIRNLRQIQLIACNGCELGAVIEIVEEILIGKRASWRILGKGLESVQISISRGDFVKASFDDRKFVITSRGIVTNADIFPQEFLRDVYKRQPHPHAT